MSDSNNCDIKALEDSQADINDPEFFYRLAHPHYNPDENNYQRPSCLYHTQTLNSLDRSTALTNNTMQNMNAPSLYNHENYGWWQPIVVDTVSSSSEAQMYNVEACLSTTQSVANLDPSQIYHHMVLSPPNSPPTTYVQNSMKAAKPKRARTAFTTAQLEYLERYFHSRPYVSTADRLAISIQLGVTDKVIKTWFQNRRFKAKTEMLEAVAAMK